MRNGILAIRDLAGMIIKKERRKVGELIRCFTLVRLFYGDIKILLKNDGKQGIIAKEMGKSKKNQLTVRQKNTANIIIRRVKISNLP